MIYFVYDFDDYYPGGAFYDIALITRDLDEAIDNLFECDCVYTGIVLLDDKLNEKEYLHNDGFKITKTKEEVKKHIENLILM